MVDIRKIKEDFIKDLPWIVFVVGWAIFYACFYKIYRQMMENIVVESLPPEIKAIWFLSLASFVLHGILLVYFVCFVEHRKKMEKEVES